MIVIGPITPGTNYVQLTAATGTLAANVHNKDIFVSALFVQADGANDAFGLLQYNGDEIAEIGKAPATGDLPVVPIVSGGRAPNCYNLKLFKIKGGDANDIFRVWATQQ